MKEHAHRYVAVLEKHTHSQGRNQPIFSGWGEAKLLQFVVLPDS